MVGRPTVCMVPNGWGAGGGQSARFHVEHCQGVADSSSRMFHVEHPGTVNPGVEGSRLRPPHRPARCRVPRLEFSSDPPLNLVVP